jgi:hypothetical protein
MRTAVANGSEDRCVEIRPEQSNVGARRRPPDRQGRAHRACTEHRNHPLRPYSGSEVGRILPGDERLGGAAGLTRAHHD